MACNWARACGVFFIMFLVTIFTYAAYGFVDSRYRRSCGTDFPRLYIESASLDYPNASTIGEWTVGISIKNPNKCSKIIYSVFRAYVSKEAAGICIYTKTGSIDQLMQLPLNKTLASINSKGWQKIDNPSGGAGSINVTLETDFTFQLHPKIKLLPAKDWSIPPRNYVINWVCRDVPVWFRGKGGIMSGAPVPCEDYFPKSPYNCIYRF